jgi:hypothetical protein
MKHLEYILAFSIVALIAWFGGSHFNPRIVDNTVTDTVWVDVPYEVIVEKEVTKPVEVYIYKTVYDTIRQVVYKGGNITITTDRSTIEYNPVFLTQYPTAPRFLGIDADYDFISFTGQRVTGITQTSRFAYHETFTINLTEDGWVSFRGSNSRRLLQSHEVSLGYQYYNEVNPAIGYHYRASYGRFGLGGSIYLQENVNAGINLFFRIN